jgi:hypothetical protein
MGSAEPLGSVRQPRSRPSLIEFDTFGVGERLKIIYAGFHPALLNLSPAAKGENHITDIF